MIILTTYIVNITFLYSAVSVFWICSRTLCSLYVLAKSYASIIIKKNRWRGLEAWELHVRRSPRRTAKNRTTRVDLRLWLGSVRTNVLMLPQLYVSLWRSPSSMTRWWAYSLSHLLGVGHHSVWLIPICCSICYRWIFVIFILWKKFDNIRSLSSGVNTCEMKG